MGFDSKLIKDSIMDFSRLSYASKDTPPAFFYLCDEDEQERLYKPGFFDGADNLQDGSHIILLVLNDSDQIMEVSTLRVMQSSPPVIIQLLQ